MALRKRQARFVGGEAPARALAYRRIGARQQPSRLRVRVSRRIGMAFELGRFAGTGLALNRRAASDGATIMKSMMGDIQESAKHEMEMQTEMGQINMMIKLNEALAKIFKAVGDAVKGLAG
jgi:hypothetical protein